MTSETLLPVENDFKPLNTRYFALVPDDHVGITGIDRPTEEPPVTRRQQVHPKAFVGDDAPRDLLRRPDQSGTEAVVVLDEILKGGVCPHALRVRCGRSSLGHRVAEALHRRSIRLGDDLPQRLTGLRFGVPGDDKAVEPESDGASVGLRGSVDVGELLDDAVEVLAVAEIPVRDPPGHTPGRRGVTALEDLRVRAVVGVERLGFKREVPEPVEVTGEGEVVLGPDAAQGTDELLRAAVTLVVFQPWFTQRGELPLEPTADHVDRKAAAGQVVSGGAELGEHSRMP